jgi:hypothetical protein
MLPTNRLESTLIRKEKEVPDTSFKSLELGGVASAKSSDIA